MRKREEITNAIEQTRKELERIRTLSLQNERRVSMGMEPQNSVYAYNEKLAANMGLLKGLEWVLGGQSA